MSVTADGLSKTQFSNSNVHSPLRALAARGIYEVEFEKRINMPNWQNENFLVSDDKSLLQMERMHRFLSEEAYWCLGIPKSVLEKAIESSLCFGVYELKTNFQIGFARVVSDFATFAWLCDVYVEKPYRGQGLSKRLMECIKAHPDLQSLRRFCLTTKDAHSLYEGFGFQVTKTPSYWMEIKDNEIYKKMSRP